MNIAYFDFDDIRNPLLGAGQAQATFQVASRLVKKGHRVTVFASRFPGSQDRIEQGISYRHIGLGSQFIRLNNLAYLFFAPWQALRFKPNEFDVIVECSTAPTSTLFTPLMTKIPVIILPSMFNAAEFYKKYKLPFHLVEKFGARFYSYAMPYSEVDKAKMLALNPNLITRNIPQGVAENFFDIKPQKPDSILFLSRLDMSQKGIDLLLESYQQIAQQSTLPLIIAGHGPDQKKIAALIRSYHLEKKVSLVGSAYEKKKFALMAKAAFVVFPSRHDEMCLWTIEALAGGLPLVAFDLPESAWIPKSVAIKVPCYDVKKFAQGMIQLTQPTLNLKMRQKARAFARHFSWDKVADMTEAFMLEIITKQGKQ